MNKENYLYFIVEGKLFKSSNQYITGAEVKSLQVFRWMQNYTCTLEIPTTMS